MKKNKLIIGAIIIFVVFSNLGIKVLADASNNSVSKDLNVGFNLNEIRIPLFISFNPEVFGKSATVFSWISFAGILITIGLVIFWIYLIIRAAIKAMQSKGEAEGLEDVSKRFRSIFIGMFLTFLVPIVLSIIGILLGIGSIFTWPKMFSQCNFANGEPNPEYQYYFQAYLDKGPVDADSSCSYI